MGGLSRVFDLCGYLQEPVEMCACCWRFSVSSMPDFVVQLSPGGDQFVGFPSPGEYSVQFYM